MKGEAPESIQLGFADDLKIFCAKILIRAFQQNNPHQIRNMGISA